MTKLPIIVGFGGINSAGRSSNFHAYHRLVFSALSKETKHSTLLSLASLSNFVTEKDGNWYNNAGTQIDINSFLIEHENELLASSLIRRLEDALFDPNELLYHKKTKLSGLENTNFRFSIRSKDLSNPLPTGWTVVSEKDGKSIVSLSEDLTVMLPEYRQSAVNSAGQLPSGFDPAKLYASRNHPRGLQMMVYAASDALNSMGIEWDDIRQSVPPDQISVYAGSGLSQLDYNGNGGLMQARLLGKKVSSKQLALGYAEMPADFINAYLIGNLGTTGTNVAACATFLYNLRQGVKDIQSGASRVAIIGTSEAPITPEVIDGFATMGALADDKSLAELDALTEQSQINFRRACRPFGENVGFTLSESAQVLVLFDDELTLHLGANILGAVNDVFIHADGFKKSIASPGLGNYLSMAKAAAATQNIIGEEGLKHRSYVHSHGTGTLQNRQTESKILSDTAKQFGIQQWPVVAIKSYVGHSLASSAGDQIGASIGFWHQGILPGILTIEGVADDVSSKGLNFLLQHEDRGKDSIDAALINSKGFGGNNATASLLSPNITQCMLSARHGNKAMVEYFEKNEKTQKQASANESFSIKGSNTVIYKFDNNVLDGDALSYAEDQLKVRGIAPAIDLNITNPYEDMI